MTTRRRGRKTCSAPWSGFAPPRRRLADWYVPFAVAAAVVAVVAGSLWGVRLLGHQAVPAASPQPASPQPAGRGVAPSCPARYARQAPWVPAKPAGVDGRSRLVPAKTPSSALICGYAGSNLAKQQGRLGSVRTKGPDGQPGRADRAAQLAGAPPPRSAVLLRRRGRSADQLPHRPHVSRRRDAVGHRHRRVRRVRPRLQREFTSTGTIGPEVSKAFSSAGGPPGNRPPAASPSRTSAGSVRTRRWFPRGRPP